MSRCFRRVVLGAAVIVGTGASAQPYSVNANTSSEHFVAAGSESYAVDEADAEVVEFPRDASEAPQITRAPFESHERAEDAYANDSAVNDPIGGEIETAERARPAGRPSQSHCREYQQTVVANGRERLAYGEACLQPDGSWRVVTPPSMDGAAAERHADYQPQARHITSASMRAQQQPTRREERGYTERSYSYHPRHSPLYRLFFGWLD